MAHIESNNLTEAYPMVGGDDAYSYAKNSTYQVYDVYKFNIY